MGIVLIEIDKISPHVRHMSYIDVKKSDFYVPWRMIYDYECYYIVDGELSVTTEKDKFTLSAGDIHIMRPFTWHKREALTDIKYYGVHFDFLRLESFDSFSVYDEYVVPIVKHEKLVRKNAELGERIVYEPEGISLPMKVKVTDPAKYICLMDSLMEHFRSKNEASGLLTKSDILILLAYLLKEDPNVNVTEKYKNNSVAQFTQVLTNDYSEKIYLGDLSSELGVSSSQMRKLFRKVNKTSPREYLIEKRIEKAKRLLEEKTLSITEIGAEVGYDNVNYFSRIFKNKTGLSPSQYRNSIYLRNETAARSDVYWDKEPKGDNPSDGNSDGSKG